MDFFTNNDWLNREGPYSFKIEHFMFILLAVIVGVFLSLFLRKKSKKTIKIVLIVLWAIAVSIELIYYIELYHHNVIDPERFPFRLNKALPLHSCLMFMYIFPFAMFSKNKVIYKSSNNFLVVVNMIMGFITMFVGCPGPGYSVFSYQGMTTLIFHALIFIVPLIMVVTNYYDLKKWDILYGVSLFGILATLIWIFDAVAGCDYFFIYTGDTFGVLYVISDNVPSIVWTLITVSCYVITAFVTHFLVYFLKQKLAKKEAPVDEQ